MPAQWHSTSHVYGPGLVLQLATARGGTCPFHCFNLAVKRRSVTVPAGPDDGRPSVRVRVAVPAEHPGPPSGVRGSILKADPEIPNSRSLESRYGRKTPAGIGKPPFPDQSFGRPGGERETGPRLAAAKFGANPEIGPG